MEHKFISQSPLCLCLLYLPTFNAAATARGSTGPSTSCAAERPTTRSAPGRKPSRTASLLRLQLRPRPPQPPKRPPRPPRLLMLKPRHLEEKKKIVRGALCFVYTCAFEQLFDGTRRCFVLKTYRSTQDGRGHFPRHVAHSVSLCLSVRSLSGYV